MDLISERDGEPVAIEIKAGSKINSNNLRGLKYWQKYQPKSHCVLIHGGRSKQLINENINAVPWTEVANL